MSEKATKKLKTPGCSDVFSFYRRMYVLPKKSAAGCGMPCGFRIRQEMV